MNEDIKPLENRTILVVDDDEISVKTIIRNLREAGAKVRYAKKLRSARRYLNWFSHRFDLVLVDRMMPNNGINLLKEIKENPTLKEIPVVIESGSGGSDEYFTALESGAIDLWYKPIEKNYLLCAVKQIVG